jgi:hypothetical protein
MMARTKASCCPTGYTTRSYDTSGNKIWSANYFGGSSAGAVTCQAVDASRVYVGGSRITASGTSWSVVCFDIVTGQFLWSHDLLNDLTPTDPSLGIPIQMQIDTSGNLSCMLWPGAYNSTTAQKQNFVVLDTTGATVATYQYTQPTISGKPIYSVDFTINGLGDYHIAGSAIGLTDSNGFVNDFHMLDWASGFGSSPTDHHITDLSGSNATASGIIAACMFRQSSHDYISGKPRLVPGSFTNGSASPLLWSAPSMWGGPSGNAIATSFSSFSQNIFQRTLTLPGTAITATGTTQGTAAALTANTAYNITRSTGNLGVILPSASAGDRVCTAVMSPNSFGTPAQRNIYPPSGGYLIASNFTQLAVNTPITYNDGDYFVCIGGLNWIQMFDDGGIISDRISVDTSGNVFSITLTDGVIGKYIPSGALMWRKGKFAANTIQDASGNTYSIGKRSGPTGASVCARDSNGAWLWGHWNMGSWLLHGSGSTADMPRSCVAIEPSGSNIIISGCADETGSGGPCNSVNDLNFVSDPWP